MNTRKRDTKGTDSKYNIETLQYKSTTFLYNLRLPTRRQLQGKEKTQRGSITSSKHVYTRLQMKR